MANITVRNIPDLALKQIHRRAEAERRSLNSEILVLLEQALDLPRDRGDPLQTDSLSRTAQIERWEELCGRWRDDREWQEIAAEIVADRTAGREVAL